MCKKKQLLFVGGFPSGGTDLLKNILNAHPKVYINGEMPFLYKLAKFGYTENSIISSETECDRFLKLLKKINQWNNLENIDYKPTVYPANVGMLLYNIFTSKNSLIWGNKTPQNTENINILSSIFPNAKFIIITRDVRDVCLSWGNKWGKNIYLCAHKWNKRMMALSKHSNNEKILIIKYEDLLSNLGHTTSLITEFLDIEHSKNMLEYHKHVANNIDGKINYGKKIKTTNRNKWATQFNNKEIEKIEKIAFNSMLYLEYPPSLARNSEKLNRVKIFTSIVHEVLSTIFVGNRNSKKNTLKERISFLFFEIKKRIVG